MTYSTYNALHVYEVQYRKSCVGRNLKPADHLSFLETLPQSRQTLNATMSTGPTGKEKNKMYSFYYNYQYLSFLPLSFYEAFN